MSTPPDWFTRMMAPVLPDRFAEGLEKLWAEYRRMVMPPDLHSGDVANAELTFFSGAHACFEMVSAIAELQDIDAGAASTECVRQKILEHLESLQPGVKAIADARRNRR